MQNASQNRAAPGLSVAIICRDAAGTIGRTLASVRGLASEVVALDSGSTDGTIELLEAAGARVERQEWLGFTAQKNKAMELCRGHWALSLDADESLEPELRASIERAVHEDDPAVAGYELNRLVWYHGAMLRHAWQPEWKLRLVRRERARWVGGAVHERLEVEGGRIERLKGALRHDSIPSMEDFLRRQLEYARLGAAEAELERAAALKLVTSPLGAWLRQMVVRQAWRDGWRGWSAASATATAALMKHLLLLERARSEAETEDAPAPGEKDGA